MSSVKQGDLIEGLLARPWLVYLIAALVLVFPVPFTGQLLGHPEIDVWNHVWGYWFFADSFGSGSLPWVTDMLGSPGGGVLYFVDPVGAFVATPLSWIFGVGFAFNVVQLLRVLLAGWVTHKLASAVTGEGRHNYAAGLALMSSPYLLGELGNGISEVSSVWWVPLSLWAFVVAIRQGALRSWLLLGFAVGGTMVATFYYGAAVALVLPVMWLAGGPKLSDLKGLVGAAIVAVAISLPMLMALQHSIASPDALITRSVDLNLQLMHHNSVELREYLIPGFETVDFEAEYGEKFVHTGYLRWSVLILAVMAFRRNRGSARAWVFAGVWSAVLGLGAFVWWGGELLRVGGHAVPLPFGFIQEAIPLFAITHPLRFSVVAQVVGAVMVSWALVGGTKKRTAIAIGLVVLEGLAIARWPIPVADAEIPAIYSEIGASDDPRGVLDLPAEVGLTMSSSRYFWYQTEHQHPVPYLPDARSGSANDREVFLWLVHASGQVGGRGPLWITSLSPNRAAAMREHLAERYGWIVVHRDLEAQVAPEGTFLEGISQVLGEPEEYEFGWVWRL